MNERILVAEDDILAATVLHNELVRRGYQCFHTDTGQKTLDFFAGSTKADLLLLDMVFSDFNGPLICRALRQQNNSVPILGLTAFPTGRYDRALALFGAQGLLSKSAYPELITQIHAIIGGATMPGFESVDSALIRLNNTKQVLALLSVTEEKVVQLRIRGFSNAQISKYLGNKPSTVRKHWQNIIRKLNCETIEQACRMWESQL